MFQVNGLFEKMKDLTTVQKSLLNTLSHIEAPYEYLFRLYGSLARAHVGADTGLIRALVESHEPLSVEQLSKELKISPDRLGRILQFLASTSMVKKSGKRLLSADKMTETPTSPSLNSGIYLLFDIHDRTFQALPSFLSSHKYQEPQLQAYMQDAMKLHQSEGDWLSVSPIDDVLASPTQDPSRVLFVDIGGGMGHQCMRFREQYPDLLGCVVLQDITQCIARVPKPIPHDIETISHSFYDAQTIKDAKFYYLRNVLHGLPHAYCIRVLKNLIPAMDEGSRLLVVDVVLPDEGVSRQAAQLDFIMMASITGKKRTGEQWLGILVDMNQNRYF
ncbi:S-adenosyl-L-methionine-dependent methyltransferase [Corynespora cassiicola Philippines]|uniref:S-adenosyl-L-methionine-dependent methyltransferase n=1 Tax=Corynespora cassiicola Philippines TaxID=1448308 RepID=A0A2T2NPY5_CORCC|nr:S-adenosyl-L-methionine-dependent methyltransferase [Corynespora cassiicola Philippines]